MPPMPRATAAPPTASGIASERPPRVASAGSGAGSGGDGATDDGLDGALWATVGGSCGRAVTAAGGGSLGMSTTTVSPSTLIVRDAFQGVRPGARAVMV